MNINFRHTKKYKKSDGRQIEKNLTTFLLLFYTSPIFSALTDKSLSTRWTESVCIQIFWFFRLPSSTDALHLSKKFDNNIIKRFRAKKMQPVACAIFFYDLLIKRQLSASITLWQNQQCMKNQTTFCLVKNICLFSIYTAKKIAFVFWFFIFFSHFISGSITEAFCRLLFWDFKNFNVLYFEGGLAWSWLSAWYFSFWMTCIACLRPAKVIIDVIIFRYVIDYTVKCDGKRVSYMDVAVAFGDCEFCIVFISIFLKRIILYSIVIAHIYIYFMLNAVSDHLSRW